MTNNTSRKAMALCIIALFTVMSTIPPIAGCEVKRQCLAYDGISYGKLSEKLESGTPWDSDVIKTSISVNTGLPDLVFIELRAWWGSTNTTGLFVKYGVNNSGGTYNSNVPIVSNLSFFANGNKTSFDYIHQSPFFFPNIWYEGEILGGSYFFKMDEKPDTITAKADFTNLIPEANETNNNITVTVLMGVTISGTVAKNENGEIIPYGEIIELNLYDEESLSDFGYRHYWTDENGYYNMSLCPDEPLSESHVYSIMARATVENLEMLKESAPVKAGENATLDFIFEGLPPNKPAAPIGKRSGRINKTYNFFSSTVDQDGNDVYYKFDWGDGTYSGWLGPYSSGEKVWASHAWQNPESYYLKVISRDSLGTLSKWSDHARIYVGKHISIYQQILELFFQLLDDYIEKFTILDRLMEFM